MWIATRGRRRHAVVRGDDRHVRERAGGDDPPARDAPIRDEEHRLELAISQCRVWRDRGLDLTIAVNVSARNLYYSSLAYLKRLPVTHVKIDRSFVINMATDDEDAAIVSSIIGLARSLGLAVIAEGVESATLWHQLRELGCNFAQGYYISRPLPADQFTRWLDQRSRQRRDVIQLPAAEINGIS